MWQLFNEDQKSKSAYSHKYIQYRFPFEYALMTSEGDSGLLGPDIPLSYSIIDGINSLYGKTKEGLYELDCAFFSGVYGIDATKTFSGEELEALGAPTSKELSQYWASSF